MELPLVFAGSARPVDAPRFRAAQRRSIRASLTAAALLVAVCSFLSGVQMTLQSSSESAALMVVAGVQTMLAIGVVLAMRSRFRRYPTPVAFAFLLVLPVVPLVTLGIQPESIVLIPASLALIPIGIALFFAWDQRTYLVWSGIYLAIVTVGNALWGPTSLGPSEGTYLLLAVGIGTAFGILGQRRRDRQDRATFGRERVLSSLVRRSAEQQRALAELNGELDRVLEREVQGRQSIEAALAQIDSSAGAELIAATACAEIIKLPLIDSAWVVAFELGGGSVLARAGLLDESGATELLSDRWQRLPERAAAGPWVETDPAMHGAAFGAGIVPEGGMAGSVWSPLRGSQDVIGAIGCGTHDPADAERVRELLSAITTYGSIVGTLIAPDLEARVGVSAGRARIRHVLDQLAFTPFFQPIVELDSGSVVGYEALTRFADGTRPDLMFELARKAGLGVELERATMSAAILASRVLPSDAYLGVNASPELLFVDDIEDLLATTDRSVVLEITEHIAIDDYVRLRSAIEALGPRIRLAVDDAGAGYASLRHILELAPQLVKLDIGLIRGVDADPARQALIAGVGYFAVKRKMRLVAEGIETPAELAALRSLGVRFGQGYLLGRPQDGNGPGPWPGRVLLD